MQKKKPVKIESSMSPNSIRPKCKWISWEKSEPETAAGEKMQQR